MLASIGNDGSPSLEAMRDAVGMPIVIGSLARPIYFFDAILQEISNATLQ